MVFRSVFAPVARPWLRPSLCWILAITVSATVSCRLKGPEGREGASSLSATDLNLDFLPDVLRLDEASAALLRSWTPRQKQVLTMLLEHRGRPAALQGTFQKLPISHFSVDPAWAQAELVISPLDAGAKNKARLQHLLGWKDGRPTKVPVHPTATRFHSVLERLKALGGRLEPYGGLAVYPTMSRSLWVDGADGLYTLKLGTNVVGGQVQEHKLERDDDFSLEGEVKRLNVLLENTTVPRLLAAKGIVTVMDQAGGIVSARGQAGRGYGVSLRDYGPLILPPERRTFIVMPRAVLEGEGVSFPLDRQGRKVLRVQVTADFALELTAEEVKALIARLNEQVAVFMAVFHANGYSYEWLHGQNAMVGLDLARKEATLVVRDLPEARDLIVAKDGRLVLAPPKVNELGLQRIIKEFSGPHEVKESRARREASYRAYSQTLAELGITLPPGYHYSYYGDVSFIRALMGNPTFAAHFVPLMQEVRRQGRARPRGEAPQSAVY